MAINVDINQPLEFNKMSFFSKDWFSALWQGKRPLWEAWWVLGVTVYLISYLFLLVFPYPFGLLSIFLQIFFWVATWRCAPNVQNIAWYYLARFLILLSILGSLSEFL